MNSHYCDIFSDCYRCSAPYCPYEKYEQNFRVEDDESDEGEDANLQD